LPFSIWADSSAAKADEGIVVDLSNPDHPFGRRSPLTFATNGESGQLASAKPAAAVFKMPECKASGQNEIRMTIVAIWSALMMVFE
jgi:hypothetical protein